VEELAEYINKGRLNSEMIHVESEHSAISACIGASATGARTFTATSSQGLALMHEILFIASGMRLPIVMVVANRALSAPINIWGDMQDSISERDSGWIQLYLEDSQEAFDTIIHAYKIIEKVRLPVMVCIDGFTLSHLWEEVDFLSQKQVDGFLPIYNPEIKLDPKKPITMGPIGLPKDYIYFKKQQQDSMFESIRLIKEVNNEFNKKFGRKYGNGLIEEYKLKDAKTAILAMGSVCATIKEFIDQERKKGRNVGLLKIRCYRPLPKEDIQKVLKNVKNIKVIDKNISLGFEGALTTEIKSLFSDKKVEGYVMGLGGKDITLKDIDYIINNKGGWVL
jgi:pyruvate ferredoxin oxidoreductase alpha subunit